MVRGNLSLLAKTRRAVFLPPNFETSSFSSQVFENGTNLSQAYAPRVLSDLNALPFDVLSPQINEDLCRAV